MKVRKVVVTLEVSTNATIKAIRKLKGVILYAEDYALLVTQVQANVIREDRGKKKAKVKRGEEEPIRGRIW